VKKLAAVIFILLLVCGGALWFLANGSLNDFIKAQIESEGSKVTSQQVSVESVEMKLMEGAGIINGFSLSNPKQYKYKHAFSFDTVVLDINVKSLTEDPIVIDEITINNPQAFVELTNTGGANLKDILDQIEKNLPKTSDTPKEPSGKEPNIRVTKLTLAKTSLSLDLSALGNKEHQLVLRDINLTNIGGASGLPASQLGGVIAQEALSSIWSQAKKEQKKKITDKITNKLKEKALDKLNDLFK
jgi:uncharacterized protein involved in outer membrane biogenesis